MPVRSTEHTDYFERSTEHTDYFEKAFGQTYDLLNSSSSTQVNHLTQISIN